VKKSRKYRSDSICEIADVAESVPNMRRGKGLGSKWKFHSLSKRRSGEDDEFSRSVKTSRLCFSDTQPDFQVGDRVMCVKKMFDVDGVDPYLFRHGVVLKKNGGVYTIKLSTANRSIQCGENELVGATSDDAKVIFQAQSYWFNASQSVTNAQELMQSLADCLEVEDPAQISDALTDLKKWRAVAPSPPHRGILEIAHEAHVIYVKDVQEWIQDVHSRLHDIERENSARLSKEQCRLKREGRSELVHRRSKEKQSQMLGLTIAQEIETYLRDEIILTLM